MNKLRNLFACISILCIAASLTMAESSEEKPLAEFAGIYELVKDDGNFEEVLKALGVGYVVRKIATATNPNLAVEDLGDGRMAFKTLTMVKTYRVEFKLGEEYESKGRDGNTHKGVVTREGNKLIQQQTTDPKFKVVREFNGDKMTLTWNISNVVCVREYKKVQA